MHAVVVDSEVSLIQSVCILFIVITLGD